MKKHILTIIALAALLIAAVALVSCNLDATDGIYSQVASSTESTDVVTRSYLGQIGDDYYYISDEGVFKRGGTYANLLPMGDDCGYIIRNASIDTSGNIYALVQKTSIDDLNAYVYYCEPNTNGEYSLGDPINTTNYTGMLVNGLYFNSTGIYYGSSASEALAFGDNEHVNYYLETEDYAFFSIVDTTDSSSFTYKFYVFKYDGSSAPETTVNGITGDSTVYVGFQPIGDNATEFALVSYNSSNSTFNAYKLNATEVESSAWFSLISSIPYAYSSQAASFYYEDASSNKYIVFKCTNYFDIVDITDASSPSVTQKRTGFATNIRTTEISNIKESAENVFIAGTYNSLLYKLDMNNPDNDPVQI